MDRLFDKARSFGLGVKLHADQYTDFGAGAVVARHRGLSADHLEYASEATVRAMAEAGTVATLLAGAHFSLHETQKPPVELFRQLGVPMALATNANPVSSATVSPAAQMNLACYLFRLTPQEALQGFTVNAARALGLGQTAGIIAVGRAADLALWDTDDPRGIAYAIGGAPVSP
jgi:imidazolonepropionase